MGGGHVVDFCLVDFFSFAGFFHELAETFALSLAGGAELLGSQVLDKAGGDSKEEGEASAPRSETWVWFEVNDAEERGVEFVSGGDESVLFFFGLRFVVFGGFVGGFFFEVFSLEVDDVFYVGAVLFNERVGASVEIRVGGGEVDHDADGAENGDEHWELDDEGEKGAERLDVVFFI